jgi:hypothetical protein
MIEIPSELLISTTGNKINALIESTYPDFKEQFNNPEYLKNRAILATTNEIVDEINEYIMTLVLGSKKEYFSADSISNCTDTCNDADILYPSANVSTTYLPAIMGYKDLPLLVPISSAQPANQVCLLSHILNYIHIFHCNNQIYFYQYIS